MCAWTVSWTRAVERARDSGRPRAAERICGSTVCAHHTAACVTRTLIHSWNACLQIDRLRKVCAKGAITERVAPSVRSPYYTYACTAVYRLPSRNRDSQACQICLDRHILHSRRCSYISKLGYGRCDRGRARQACHGGSVLRRVHRYLKQIRRARLLSPSQREHKPTRQ